MAGNGRGPHRPLTKAEVQECIDAVISCGSVLAAANATGIPRMTLKSRLLRAPDFGLSDPTREPPATAEQFEVKHPPSADEPIEELLARKRLRFGREKAHKDGGDLIQVKVKTRGPIGILVFGDPHIDNDGTDIAALERDLDVITRDNGIFGINLGDLTDNWIGRLARLYANSSTTAADGVRLMEWMLTGRHWLAVIAGNHDMWQGSDLISWMLRNTGTAFSPHGIRLQLNFPKGDPIRIHARHDFKGHSMYNPTHGHVRETREGYRDHILLAGHRHIDHYQILPSKAAGFPSHLARVSGYKVVDDYAAEGGFHELRLGPSVCFVIDPENPNPVERIKPFWDALRAERYLRFLRQEAA